MNRILQYYKAVPMEIRYFVGWLCAFVPLLLVKDRLTGSQLGLFAGAITAFFVILYSGRKLFLFLERNRASRLNREITRQSTGPSRSELAEKEKEFRQKWTEGIDKLKKAGISFYQIPWYIVIGEPGGGKTMTLLNSGMDFPMGKDELPGFGGTRNYNWWFTNTAVILDTAGRLVFEQEGTSDRHEWEAFLNLLKKRRRCPINGVVVALPADKLMSDSAEQRHQNACIIRDRLRQIQNILDVRFPVFILVTKSDLIPGFTEFYNELDSVQRNQLFGWSRPGDFSQAYEPSEFPTHFEELYARLHHLRLHFLSRRSGDVEMGWVYTYPEAFAALKDPIRDYIEVMFSKNIFAESLFFRGFYFTSALQEGRPILKALGEHFSGERIENLEGIFPQSRAFFIHDFYVEKVAKEQGMVFRSQKHIARMRLIRNATFYVAVPLLLLFALVAFLGYRAYDQTVSGPLDDIKQAAELVATYKSKQQSGQVWLSDGEAEDVQRAIKLSQRLGRALDEVREPGGLASIMFASVATRATQNIRAVQRELVGYCILRPQVAKVEKALTDRSESRNEITPDNIEAHAVSLAAYIDWFFGSPTSSFEDLCRCLSQKERPQGVVAAQLVSFLSDEGGLAGRGSGALTSNRRHQREIINAGLDRLETYLQSSASKGPTGWWSTLLQICDDVRASYRDIIAAGGGFSRARTRASFEEITRQFLAAFPSAVQSTHSEASLLRPLRAHLAAAPRDSEGRITTIEQLLQENSERNESLCNTMLSAIPQNFDSSTAEFSEALRNRINQLREHLTEQNSQRRVSIRLRLNELEGLLIPTPRTAPEHFDFTESAEQTERILSRLVEQLHEASAAADAYVDAWTAQLDYLIEQQPPGLRLPTSPEWEPTRLQRLVESAFHARRRYQIHNLVEEISRALDPAPQFGLAQFMEGADDHDRARSLRFSELKNRHAASFLIGTIRAGRNLRKTLSAAVEEGLLLHIGALDELLDESIRQYVQQYLLTWAEAYDNYRLQDLAGAQFGDSWDDYRHWLRAHAESLERDYREHLEGVLNHVVLVVHSSASETQPEIHEELSRHLETMPWPHDSHMARLLFEVGAEAASDHRQIIRKFEDYTRSVEGFRFERIEDLDHTLAFPKLAAQLPALQNEWLTVQLQHIISFGQWLLQKEVYGTLFDDYLSAYASERPFIFEGGGGSVDPLRLQATLRAMNQISSFFERDAGGSEWLDAAEQWHDFLAHERFEIEMACVPPESGSNRRGPADYYREVAWRLPGIQADGGILTFSTDAAERRFVRWQPQDGLLAVTLRGQTPRAEQAGTELEPRLFELRDAPYGLIELVQERGRRVEGRPDEWIVSFEVNLAEIGVDGDADPVRAVIFRVRFVDPEEMPAPIEWVDLMKLCGPRPSPPWA